MSNEITTTINIPSNGALVRGETQRHEFGAMERRQSAELSAVAQAAVAEATIKARYIMAERKPSSFDTVRSTLLKDCGRKSFAESAWYSKPMAGGRVEGPSIRFAEAFMRARGNIAVDTPTVHDDDERRIVRVSVTDLEANTTLSKDVTLSKHIERKNGDKREVVSVRQNSRGEATYVVRATEDEIATKEAAQVSKALRTLALRLCPGDLLDEAKAEIMRTRARGGSDPDLPRKELLDQFEMQLGIRPAQLAEYLGHPTDTMTPDEILDLQSVFAAIKTGEAKWMDYLADARAEKPAAAVSSAKATIMAAAASVAPKPVAISDPNAEPPHLIGVDEFEKQVSHYRAAIIALRPDQQTEEEARAALSKELGRALYDKDEVKARAWLDKAEALLRAREAANGVTP